MFLFPFLEAVVLHDRGVELKLYGKASVANDSANIRDCHGGVPGDTEFMDFLQAMGGVSAYRCPSSRSTKVKTVGMLRTGPGGSTTATANPIQGRGPTTDYAAVLAKENLAPNYWLEHCIFYSPGTEPDDRAKPERFVGPFRLPSLTFTAASVPTENLGIRCKSITNWELVATFATWQDGTTNQIIFVEKHIPAWALDQDHEYACFWDGGYHFTNANQWGANSARVVSAVATLFARGPNDPNRPDDSTANNRNPANQPGVAHIGSSHPTILNVLVGDGSVRAWALSTHPDIAARLACTLDGATVAMP